MISDSKKISFLILGGIKNEILSYMLKKENGIDKCNIDSSTFLSFLNKVSTNGLEGAIKDRMKELSINPLVKDYVVLFCDGDYNKLKNLYLFLKIIKPSNIFIDSYFYAKKNEETDDFTLSDFVIINNSIHSYQNKPEFISTGFTNSIINFKELFKTFIVLDNSSYLLRIMDLYMEADDHTQDYVKLILYVSVLEMLNVDDTQHNITYKVARLPAVLLGINEEISEKVFKNIKRIYKIRCELVHEAKFDNINSEINEYLSNIISNIFLTLLSLDKIDLRSNSTKKSLFNVVNNLGFGQREKLFTENSSSWVMDTSFLTKDLFGVTEDKKHN
jgi:hypothetical protein